MILQRLSAFRQSTILIKTIYEWKTVEYDRTHNLHRSL